MRIQDAAYDAVDLPEASTSQVFRPVSGFELRTLGVEQREPMARVRQVDHQIEIGAWQASNAVCLVPVSLEVEPYDPLRKRRLLLDFRTLADAVKQSVERDSSFPVQALLRFANAYGWLFDPMDDQHNDEGVEPVWFPKGTPEGVNSWELELLTFDWLWRMRCNLRLAEDDSSLAGADANQALRPAFSADSRRFLRCITPWPEGRFPIAAQDAGGVLSRHLWTRYQAGDVTSLARRFLQDEVSRRLQTTTTVQIGARLTKNRLAPVMQIVAKSLLGAIYLQFAHDLIGAGQRIADKECPRCHHMFTPRDRRQKYCENPCTRQRVWKERNLK
jgi:hypothetical protein